MLQCRWLLAKALHGAFNGQTGFQIESKSADSATLAYTLAGRQNQQLDANKLQRACQKVLNTQKTYKLQILSVNEIANPALENTQYGRQIGNTRANFGLSNTLTYVTLKT